MGHLVWNDYDDDAKDWTALKDILMMTLSVDCKSSRWRLLSHGIVLSGNNIALLSFMWSLPAQITKPVEITAI